MAALAMPRRNLLIEIRAHRDLTASRSEACKPDFATPGLLPVDAEAPTHRHESSSHGHYSGQQLLDGSESPSCMPGSARQSSVHPSKPTVRSVALFTTVIPPLTRC